MKTYGDTIPGIWHDFLNEVPKLRGVLARRHLRSRRQYGRVRSRECCSIGTCHRHDVRPQDVETVDGDFVTCSAPGWILPQEQDYTLKHLGRSALKCEG